MHNSTILTSITIFTLLTNILSLTGQSRIQLYIYQTYSKLTQLSKYKDLKNLKKESIEVNKQRNLISAQDNYAKWTKLNRKFDKLNEDISNLESQLNSNKLKVDSIVSLILKILTVGAINLLKVWYCRTSLFYLPEGLFPWFMESLVLNFPFLSKGSIGIYFWCFCLNKIFWLIVELVKLIFVDEPVVKPVNPGSSKSNSDKESPLIAIDSK